MNSFIRATRCLLVVAVVADVAWTEDPSLTVWPVSSLVKVRPTDPAPPGAAGAVTLHAARNEWESFQVVLRARKAAVRAIRIRGATLTGTTGAVLGPPAFLFNRVAFVKIRTPSRAGSKTGLWPDPLPPLQQPFDLAPAQGNLPIWITVKVGPRTPAGQYTGTLWFTADNIQPFGLPVHLLVHDVDLPTDNGPFTAWFEVNVADVLNAHNVAPGEATRGSGLVQAYRRFLLERRMSPAAVPAPPGTDAAAAWVADPRVGLFRVPELEDPRTAAEAAQWLANYGIGSRAVAVVGNPTPADRRTGRLRRLRQVLPGVHLLRRAKPTWTAADADLWCLPPAKWTVVETAALSAAGQQAWWQLDDSIRDPLPSLLIDEPAVGPRVLCWLAALGSVRGMWCRSVTRWSRIAPDGKTRRPVNVWTNPEIIPGANGAGYLLYPGKPVGVDGPVSSLRLELLRDGLEDLVCLRLLENALNRRAASLGLEDYQFGRERVRELIRRVGRNLTTFRTDPHVLESARIELLKSLAHTRDALPLLVRSDPPEGVPIVFPGDGIQLVGATNPAASVTINDQPVTTNSRGLFRARAYPVPGRNEFTVTARLGAVTVNLVRGWTVIRDPELTRLEQVVRQGEQRGLKLTAARTAMKNLQARYTQGTYTHRDRQRARALITETERKLSTTALEHALAVKPGSAEAGRQVLVTIARSLNAARDYARSVRVLQQAVRKDAPPVDAPCRITAGTHYGKVGFLLTNGWVSVVVWRQGGRIADFRVLGLPLLQPLQLEAVPDNAPPPLKAQLGGIADAELDSDRLSLINWNLAVLEEFDERITLAARAVLAKGALRLERRLTLTRGSPEVVLSYRVTNPGPGPVAFRWRARMCLGLGFPPEGPGGDPRHDLLWVAPTGTAGLPEPLLNGQRHYVVHPAKGVCAVYDPGYRLGLGLIYDDRILTLGITTDEQHQRYWLEPNSGQDGRAARIDPQDLLHFTLRLTPVVGVASEEALSARLTTPRPAAGAGTG